MKKIILGIIALGVLVGAGAVAFAFLPTQTRQIAAQPKIDDPAVIEAGRYVAVASDCVACHTGPSGVPFAGGLPMHTPIGVVYSTNITPHPEAGIGSYTLDQFDRAVRHGVLPGGSTLYPAMPYPSYARLSDEDVAALYAYFMKGVDPAAETNKVTEIPWPMSMRWPLAIWRKVFAPAPSANPFDPSRYPDPVIARGAYLVQGPGHCGSCHTPRAVSLQEEGLDESSDTYLAGGQIIDGWFAVNLRGNTADGLGSWSVDDIVAALKTGRNEHHAVIGSPMSDVVVHSMQNMTDEDLRAIAAYLKTLPPASGDTSSFAADDTTAKDFAAGRENGRGAEIYADNCAACHLTNGRGAASAIPAIGGNSSVLASDPISLIRVVLEGAALPVTKTRPSNLGMPGFGWRLSDQEVAELLTFIRKGWGNNASAVSAEQVKAVRDSLEHEQREASAGHKGGPAPAHATQ